MHGDSLERLAWTLANEPRIGRRAANQQIAATLEHIPEAHSLDAAELLSQHHHFLAALALIARWSKGSEQTLFDRFRVGVILYVCRRPHQAIPWFEAVLRERPNDPGVLTELAVAQLSVGALAQAKTRLEAALVAAPTWIPALHELALIAPEDEQAQMLSRLRVAARDVSKMPRRWITRLQFALGKIYDDLGEYDRAWDAYECGSREAYKKDDERLEERAHERSSAVVLSASPYQSGPGDRVVFIVGLPRSGTTLVEQLMLGAEEAASVGETPALRQSVSTWLHSSDPNDPTNLWREPVLTSLRDDYTSFWPDYAVNGARVIIDKTPGNYLWAIPAVRALPNARVIHSRREPMDICWSLYTTWFGAGTLWSYDLQSIANAYTRYHRATMNWKTLLGDSLMELDHQEVVQSPNEVTHRIYAHAGLVWSPAALNIEKRSNPVVTPSMTQVRQAIGSVRKHRYKPYLDRLAPLIDSLQSQGVDVG